MRRFKRFTFLCNSDERRAIADLASHLQRSESDAVRYVVVEAVKQLIKVDPSPADPPPEMTKHGEGGALVTD